MADWFSNGRRVESFSIEDRGLHYGDGLFETVAIRDGQPRLWGYHMERLAAGGERLGIGMPGPDKLQAALGQALEESKLAGNHGLAKIILTAGAGRRGYGRSPDIEPSLAIGVFATTPEPAESYRSGVDTLLCKTRLGQTPALAGLKTLNRLEQVLARSEVLRKDLFEGLTMDADGNVICGTMSNVFFVNNKTIGTPPLDRCGVSGVMRRHVIAVLRENASQVKYRSATIESLADADEVFLSNSQFGILAVRSCGDLRWPVGETTRRVMTLLADNGVAECPA